MDALFLFLAGMTGASAPFRHPVSVDSFNYSPNSQKP